MLNTLCGIHRVYVPKKNNKSTIFFNNRDIESFMKSRCGKGTAIESKAIREAMKKNRATALSKLDKTFPCLFFVCALFYFVFHYKSLASTDAATIQVLIHRTVAIYSEFGYKNINYRY